MPNIGDVLDGEVIKIIRKGAIFKLSTGRTGFLHISEISNDYVKSINDYLEYGKKVKVMVLATKMEKIYLSIRKIPSFGE